MSIDTIAELKLRHQTAIEKIGDIINESLGKLSSNDLSEIRKLLTEIYENDKLLETNVKERIAKKEKSLDGHDEVGDILAHELYASINELRRLLG